MVDQGELKKVETKEKLISTGPLVSTYCPLALTSFSASLISNLVALLCLGDPFLSELRQRNEASHIDSV